MKLARRVHLLLGVFFAPTIMFFAATGAMQIIGLQKSKDGKPAASWILHVVEVHKHQKWEPRKRPPAPPAAAAAATSGAPATAAPAPPANPEPALSIGTRLLEGFAVAMSACLVATTLLGLYMAWLLPRDRKLCVVLFGAGLLVPAGFLLF